MGTVIYTTIHMNVLVIGGAGFVGKHLVPHLQNSGHMITVVDLMPFPDQYVKSVQCNITTIDPQNPSDEVKEVFSQARAIINLAGVTIAGRFTKERKKLIYDSRIQGTRKVALLLENLKNHRVQTYISASAVGYYGDQKDTLLDESSKPGNTFLSEVVQHWEEETKRFQNQDIRVVRFRQGHILGKNGGYLSAILPMYKKGLGGPIGSGEQYLPWIHVGDLVRRYAEAVINPSVHGTHNMVAGEPITAMQFSQTLATILSKSHKLKVPVWVVALKYGELAKEMAASQRVISKRGHVFVEQMTYTTIDDALLDCLS